MEIYQVGGCVRDKILGLKPKDIDYTVVAPSYECMKNGILERGGKIFLEKPEYFTIRASLDGIAADFVLARKDGAYTDGRRPDSVEVGTLLDDLSRRDFTMNAIAMDKDGNYIDPFNGVEDIRDNYIRCVGNVEKRMKEDALRMIRALRFSVTKNFDINWEIQEYIRVNYKDIDNVSIERIAQELDKMFEANCLKTVILFREYYSIFNRIFQKKITLRTKVWQ